MGIDYNTQLQKSQQPQAPQSNVVPNAVPAYPPNYYNPTEYAPQNINSPVSGPQTHNQQFGQPQPYIQPPGPAAGFMQPTGAPPPASVPVVQQMVNYVSAHPPLQAPPVVPPNVGTAQVVPQAPQGQFPTYPAYSPVQNYNTVSSL